MTNFLPGAGLTFRAPDNAGFLFSLIALPGMIDYAATTVPMTIKDANITRITSDYSDPYYDIQIQGDATGVVLSVLDATGVLDSNNRLSRVSNGNCRVQGDSWLKRSIINCDMTRINDNVYDELVNYVTGSLARHMVDAITTLIGSKTAESKPIFSVQNHATATYVRNVDCWAYPINLTAISPWNSRGANTRAGAAFTPRNTLHASHYPVAVSDTLRFVTSANEVVTRTVTGVQSLDNSDIQITLLDSDLPESITPLKLLPANVLNYLPSLESFPIPVLATDYEEKTFIKETNPANWVNGSLLAFFRSPTIDPLSRVVEAIIPGDSGNPICMCINGNAVLMSHWQGVDVGPLYSSRLSEIASALTTLGGGYSLSTINLSSFTNYGI